VLGVALDGLDQVRDQIVALLELHVDIGKGLADALAERDQAVIRPERKQHDDDDDAENDPAGRHGRQLLWDEEAGKLDEKRGVRQPARELGHGVSRK
jgi:hypothetical protein